MSEFDEILDNPKLDADDIGALYFSMKEIDNHGLAFDIPKRFRDNEFVGCYDFDVPHTYKLKVYKDEYWIDDEHRKQLIELLEMLYDFSNPENVQHKNIPVVYTIVHTSIDLYSHDVSTTVDSVFLNEDDAKKEMKKLENSAWRDESSHYFKITKTRLYK